MIVVGQLLVDSHSHTASAGWQHEKYFQLTVSTVSLAELMVSPKAKPLETVGGKYFSCCHPVETGCE